MAFGNEYIDDYGTCEKTHASLLVRGGPDSPESVTELLGIQPTRMRVIGRAAAWRRGEWYGESSGLIARDNMWLTSSEDEVDSRDSLRHIDYLLELLEGKGLEMAALQSQGWESYISVFWDSRHGHGGPRLTPPTMQQLAQLGLELSYDVYYTDPGKEPEEVEGHPGWHIVSF